MFNDIVFWICLYIALGGVTVACLAITVDEPDDIEFAIVGLLWWLFLLGLVIGALKWVYGVIADQMVRMRPRRKLQRIVL